MRVEYKEASSRRRRRRGVIRGALSGWVGESGALVRGIYYSPGHPRRGSGYTRERERASGPEIDGRLDSGAALYSQGSARASRRARGEGGAFAQAAPLITSRRKIGRSGGRAAAANIRGPPPPPLIAASSGARERERLWPYIYSTAVSCGPIRLT